MNIGGSHVVTMVVSILSHGSVCGMMAWINPPDTDEDSLLDHWVC